MSELKAPEISLERRRSMNEPLEPISSEELFGNSYVLLAASDGHGWCEAAETVRSKKLPGISFDCYRIGSKGLRDPEGRFCPAYGLSTTGAVLVCPDRSIAWKAEALKGDPEAALRDAFSHLLGTKPLTAADGAAAADRAERGNGSAVSAASVVTNRVSRRRPVQPMAAGGFYNPYAMPVPSVAAIKLYVHPLSVFSRPIRLFVAESGLKIQQQVVDLAAGEHRGAEYTQRNPSQLVPMLEENDFRLTESAAILKYLADKTNSPAYPSDPVRRAKIDEMMDWLNTQFYRDWGFNLCLPQIFPHHKRRSEEAHAGAIEWGQQNSRRWLQVLNDHWIGENDFLVGNRITIADYFGIALVTLGEAIHTDFSKYPNVARWIGNMKGLKNWNSVNEAFDGFVGSTKGKSFQTV